MQLITETLYHQFIRYDSCTLIECTINGWLIKVCRYQHCLLSIVHTQSICVSHASDQNDPTFAQSEVTAFAEECGRELAAAEPVIKEAEAALNSLDKGSLGELKSFGSPAAEVVQVVSACIVLTAPGGKIPKVSILCLFMQHRRHS